MRYRILSVYRRRRDLCALAPGNVMMLRCAPFSNFVLVCTHFLHDISDEIEEGSRFDAIHLQDATVCLAGSSG